MYPYEATIRIKELNDLPLIVEYEIGEAQPDVGYTTDYVENWEIVGIGSRYFRKGENTRWIVERAKPFFFQIEEAIADQHWS